MDRKLFKETFSALRAPEEAISEVIDMTQNHDPKKHIRLPRALGILAACLALMMGLAVTANAATGGELFDEIFFSLQNMIRLNDYKQVVTAENGEEFTLFGTNVDLVRRDGRSILIVGEDETDITDALTREGACSYERTSGGTTCRVEVTGTPEDWTLRLSVFDQGEGPDLVIVRTSDRSGSSLETADGEVIVTEYGFGGQEPEEGMKTYSVFTCPEAEE